MATRNSVSATLQAVAYLLFLALTISCAASARTLSEDAPPVPAADPPLPDVEDSNPVDTHTPDVDVAPEAAPDVDVAPEEAKPVHETPDPEAAPEADKPVQETPAPEAAKPVEPEAPKPVHETPAPEEDKPAEPVHETPAPEADKPVETDIPDVAPEATPAATQPNAGSAAAAKPDPHHPLTFFMHDVLGGSNPSARAVTGIVTNPAVNGQVPFARPNGAVLPLNNGVPVNNDNSGIINNNNIPFLTGLGGTTSAVTQNNGNNFINGGSGFPLVNGGQLPAGTTIQKLMFGTMTVIDNELTEGHELGSGLVGKAQGFYVASSEDGTSQTMAFTAMFESGHYADSLSFFGVHRTVVSESQLAIMGGTGKYVNAKGYASIKTIPSATQHATDGVETLLEFTVYLTY